ncbi:MAG: DUF2914 domain-containing protein [Acidiferrobacterales bacterium]
MSWSRLILLSIFVAVPLHATDTTNASVPPTEGWVARATLTTAMQEREPVDSVSSLSSDRTKLYYFTEIRDMTGQTVKHRWEYNGELKAEVEFHIGGPRWRVYSSKTLLATWIGDWKVSVVDASGKPLSVNTFVYAK